MTTTTVGQVNDETLKKGKNIMNKQEIKIYSNIRIDSSVSVPVYLDWADEMATTMVTMHPELENGGPLEYDATKLVEWFAPGQEVGVVTGEIVYRYLKDNDLLSTCIGLTDLVEIQKKGIGFFRQNWKGKVVFGWRSIARNRHNGELAVLCLHEKSGELQLLYLWIGTNVWSAKCPALRLASD